MQVWTNSKLNGEVDTLDYNIITNHDVTTIKRVNTEYSNKEIAGQLEDTGDQVIIGIGSKAFSLDYEEVVVLLALLMASYNDKLELRETKTIKSI